MSLSKTLLFSIFFILPIMSMEAPRSARRAGPFLVAARARRTVQSDPTLELTPNLALVVAAIVVPTVTAMMFDEVKQFLALAVL